MEEKESNPLTKEEIIKLVAIVGVLLIIFLYSVLSGNSSNRKNTKVEVTNATISEMLTPIKDNYSLKIKRRIGNNEETIEYITDGTLELYNVIGQNNGYLIYKGKAYYVESKGNKIKQVKKTPDYINDTFSSIDFIKKLTNYCDIKDVKATTFDCYVKIHDYLEEYNVVNATKYTYDGEDQMIFRFKYGNIISHITIDYSNVYKAMNKNDIITYDIKIEKVNDNDYSNLLEVFKDTLK